MTFFFFFFFNDPATTEIYTLSLHDALPISMFDGRLTTSLAYFDIAQKNTSVTNSEFFRLQSLGLDRKSTRLNSSHVEISYAVFCLKKKKKTSLYLNFTHF